MDSIINDIKLTCPLCKEKLIRYDKNKLYKCSQNHSYDIAKQGYVNLIISNQKRSKNPGDSREMVIARVDFLNRGFYKAISDKINEVIYDYLKVIKNEINILDIGCGEAYYLTKLKKFISTKKINANYYGMDVSKEAIKYAAKVDKDCIFAVGNNYHLPLSDCSIDCVLSVFSPIDIDEINRVLKNDGIFVRVLPRINHLIELRNIIYYEVNLNDKVYIADENKYVYIREENVTFNMSLDKEEIQSLLKMTPHYWKSTPENRNKLESFESLDITVDMRIGVFKKKL